MFTHSSQKRFWLFAGVEPIEEMRKSANSNAVDLLKADYPDFEVVGLH